MAGKEKELPPILKDGYGYAPKAVMRDPELSIEAKAIYSYLATFAGNRDIAYPNVSLICSQLNISERRFRRYKDELVQKGYITVERYRKENGFSNNIYRLSGYSVSGQIVPVQNVRERIVSIQNDSTNNNSIKSNSSKNNNSNKNNTSAEPMAGREYLTSKASECDALDIDDMKGIKDNYIQLTELDDDFLNYYCQKFKEKLGVEHPPILKRRINEVIDKLNNLTWEDVPLHDEDKINLIDKHFESLPKKNDGKIYGFLHDGVQKRLLEDLLF